MSGFSGKAGTLASILAAGVSLTIALAASPASAQAASPWWRLHASSRPTHLPPAGEGALAVAIGNAGDAFAEGGVEPVTVTDTLPAGLTATSARLESALVGIYGSGECSVAAVVVCTYSGSLPPYEQLELVINVTVEPGASSGELNMVSVSGGGAPGASTSQPITVDSSPTPFGLESYELSPEGEGGSPAPQAGSHPFQLTTSLYLNQGPETGFRRVELPGGMPKDLTFTLPPGLVGNPSPFPTCSDADFSTPIELGINSCPPDTQVGVADVTISGAIGHLTIPEPLFALKPAHGEPARFGFLALIIPVILDTSVRTGADYGVTVSVRNISQLVGFFSAETTFWGVPGAAAHDISRGNGCVGIGRVFRGCSSPHGQVSAPLLSMPTSCGNPSTEPLTSSVTAAPWNDPSASLGSTYRWSDAHGTPLALDGCNRLNFEPSIGVTPDGTEVSKPTGLGVDVHIPQNGALAPEGLAVSNLRGATVTLPEGVTLNPGGADGLQGCTEAQAGFTGFEEFNPGLEPGETATFTSEPLETLQPGVNFCPNGSKVATAKIATPLLPEPLEGAVYLATPYQNPFDSLLAVYLIAENPVAGTLIKQAGEVKLDPASGQLTTTFKNTPDLPFEDLTLHFFGGNRAPLVTPALCGEYTTKAVFTPWSGNGPVDTTAGFSIDQGSDGGPCPSGGAPPFHPNLNAGTRSNAAGHYSPLDLELSRGDSEQEFTHFSVKLPPGLSGKLAGIPECSDAAIAAAKARSGQHGGQEEEEAPSCPAASEIGHTLVGAGVGSVLVWAPGKLYLAGPYHGSNLSVVSITSAHVGAFDLGTVVVREALKINPETAEVFVDATGSDPLPHIINGVPTHLRKILVYLDRPEFTLNPTSCEPMSIASTALGSGADFATEADDVPFTATSPFQASDCASLPFKPKLGLKLLGGTRRGAHPRLKATLHMNGIGEAAISRAQVTLPRSEFLENAHIGTVCTRVQFNGGPGNGAQCPAASVYGFARAVTPILSEPLEGPVYLRANGGERKLPDLLAALHNSQIDIDLEGHIDSAKGRIRNTFEAVPDAPVTKFTLEMQGGRKGLLVNSENLCARPHRATSHFTGHNGMVFDTRPVLSAKCGGKAKKNGKAHKRSGAHR